MKGLLSQRVISYSTNAGPSKPKRASKSKLVNWKNIGDEFDEGDFTAT